MKAIVINRGGMYAQLNGKTFDLPASPTLLTFNESFITILVPNPEFPGGLQDLDIPLENLLLVDAQEVGEFLFSKFFIPRWRVFWITFKKWAKIHNFKFDIEKTVEV